jgi:hypothetical protein
MLFTGNVPTSLWEQTCNHVVYIRNRLGHPALNWHSPYFVCEGFESDDFKRLKVFYSPCYPVTDAYYNKFSAETDECKWIGLSEDVRGTIVYRPKDQKIFVAGMLTTYENPNDLGKLLNDRKLTKFDIQDNSTYKYLISKPRNFVSAPYTVRELHAIVAHRAYFDEDEEVHLGLLKIMSRPHTTPYWVEMSLVANSQDGKFFLKIYEYILRNDIGTNFPLFAIINLRPIHERPGIPNPEGLIFGYDKYTRYQYGVALDDGTTRYYKTNKIEQFDSKKILFTSHLTAAQAGAENINKVWPKSRDEAMLRHDWPAYEAAEDKEIVAFVEMGYFKHFEVVRPRGHFIHTSKFVYQVHFHTDGSLNKYKVRFVVRGFTFVIERDYFETFAPVTQTTSIKLFYVMALYYGIDTQVFDVKSAYLNAELDAEIWVELPKGFNHDGARYGLLSKAIPGVKQGAYLWWTTFRKSLEESGFTIAQVEPCLFIFWKNGTICILLVHTDNILVACNDFEWWHRTHSAWPFLTQRVDNRSILGLQIERTGPHTCTFCQPQYIEDLIKEFDISGRKEAKVPLRDGIERDYNPDSMSKNTDPKIPFRSLCMKLYWIARCYRGHLLYACNFFARFAQCYTAELFDEMLNTLSYIARTKSWKLFYEIDPSLPLGIIFSCDASYSNISDMKSTFGCFGWIQKCLVYAQSSTISIRVTSSCESESHAIFEAVKAAIYIRNWLLAFCDVDLPMLIFNDNSAAIQILGVRSNGTLSKHFAPRLRYVTDLVEQKLIKLFHVPRGMNAGADLLTHSLGRIAYERGLTITYGDAGLQGLIDVAACSSGADLRSPFSCLTVIEYSDLVTGAEALSPDWD